jgi:ribosomal protein S27E
MVLTITDFVMWTLMGSSGLMLACALFSRYLHARAEHRGLARRVICRLCLHAFEDSSRDTNVRCPACGALTAKGTRNGLS